MKTICRSIGKVFKLRDSSEFIKSITGGAPIAESLVKSFKGIFLTIDELSNEFTGGFELSQVATKEDILVLQNDVIYKFISLEGPNVFMQRIGYLFNIGSNPYIKLFVKEGEKLISKKAGEKITIMNRYFSDAGIYNINKIKEQDSYNMCVSATLVEAKVLEDKNKEFLMKLLAHFDSSVYEFKLVDTFIASIDRELTLLTVTKKTETGEEIIQFNPVIYFKGFKVFDIPHI